MKRLTLALVAAVALSASACGTDDQPAAAPSPSATAGSSPAPDRFQQLWTQYRTLERRLDPQWHPTTADEANRAAGLDETTDLRFADMADAAGSDDGGQWCLESARDTYLAMTYGGGDSTVLMGDGACDYDEATAKVVGDFIAGDWTRGADLMGDIDATLTGSAAAHDG